jgi:hypothetical protein
MYKFFFLFWFSAAAGETGTFVYTWVFGKKRNMGPFIKNLDINPDIPTGFIRLIGDKNSLTIALVQRPLKWPSDQRFCSPMLRMAVREFYIMTGLEIKSIRSVFVNNQATPREAGCRCYVGLMVDMGFRKINEFEMLEPDDVPRFCAEGQTGILVGQLLNTKPSLPSFNAGALKLLLTAHLDETWIPGP